MTTPLKLARKRLKLSAVALAARVGVQTPTIYRIENGTKRPSPELTIKLAEATDGILTRDQIMFPEFHAASKKPVRSVRLQEAR